MSITAAAGNSLLYHNLFIFCRTLLNSFVTDDIAATVVYRNTDSSTRLIRHFFHDLLYALRHHAACRNTTIGIRNTRKYDACDQYRFEIFHFYLLETIYKEILT